MGQSRPLFVYLRSFLVTISIQLKLKTLQSLAKKFIYCSYFNHMSGANLSNSTLCWPVIVTANLIIDEFLFTVSYIEKDKEK